MISAAQITFKAITHLPVLHVKGMLTVVHVLLLVIGQNGGGMPGKLEVAFT